ncbi:MAG: PadR family transcriptional regulator [Methanobacteriaceae archaeon]|jgi:DNA-binding PadR family transcriptional regulator|nr:PadR family transcriptional regulator [Candidatus Methanorudis spinitermitis]
MHHEKIAKYYKKDHNLFDSDYDVPIIVSLMNGFLKLIILWIISKERIHGYEIIKKMKEGLDEDIRNKGFVGPGSNRIYPILQELEKKGLIEGDLELQGKRKVKYYEITEKGKNTINVIRKKPKKNIPPIIKDFWEDVIIGK